jgi:light-regulated signal transduction histidine kinase (bacteriophytochrome)
MRRVRTWWSERTLRTKGGALMLTPPTLACLGLAVGGAAPRALGAALFLGLGSAGLSLLAFERSILRAARRNRDNALRLVQRLPLEEPPVGRDDLAEAGQALVIAAWLLGERETALRRSRAELERSNRDLERFASAASHDLQEPLRMIASYVRLLREDLAGRLDEEAERCMGFIEDGARRLKGMIDGLLAYSRVSTWHPEPEPVDLEEVLEECRHRLAIAIAESRATVTADPLPVVMGSRAQLVQLLQNLLANAVKFHGDRPPSVHVSARPSGDRWIVSVRDDGIGIPPEAHERILEMFERLHTGKEYPGTGIGLAICQRIAELHGGRIWVDSEPGRGSTFHVSLPAADRAAAIVEGSQRPVLVGRSA